MKLKVLMKVCCQVVVTCRSQFCRNMLHAKTTIEKTQFEEVKSIYQVALYYRYSVIFFVYFEPDSSKQLPKIVTFYYRILFYFHMHLISIIWKRLDDCSKDDKPRFFFV